MMCGQHNQRATARDNTGHNTDKEHTPSPMIEIKISDPTGNRTRVPGWKAVTLPTTTRVPSWSVNGVLLSLSCPPLWNRRLHARLPSSGPGFDLRSWQVSWVRFFRGFSSPVTWQETLASQGSRISFGRRHHDSIFALLGWLSVCLVCIVFHVCAVSEVAPALGWSLIRGGPPCPCGQKSIYVIHSLIPSPDGSWLCKARAAWVT